MPDGAPMMDPDIVAGRIVRLLEDQRPGAVKPLLAALEKLAPDYKTLPMLRAACWCQLGDVPQALGILEDALTRDPKNAAAHLHRAEILFGQADYAGAASAAADAVLVAPQLARAKAILGLALFRLGLYDQSRLCLEESFAADPGNVDAGLALAVLSPDAAVPILTRVIALRPHLVIPRNMLMRRLFSDRDIEGALRIGEQARQDGVADIETFGLLAFAQLEAALWDEAAMSIARVRSLKPDHAWGARLAAGLAGRETGVITLPLQRNAAAFEESLFSGGTILPGTFRSLLQGARAAGPVLDLFCGTGLNAIAAQDICPGPWVGWEPDHVLLQLSRERGLYQRLESGWPLDYLGRERYSIILLNEAFAYTTFIAPYFVRLRAALAAGGIALAAVPTGADKLSGHGLFTHSESNFAAQAAEAGLALNIARTGILRRVEGIPMHGFIASLQLL